MIDHVKNTYRYVTNEVIFKAHFARRTSRLNTLILKRIAKGVAGNYV